MIYPRLLKYLITGLLFIFTSSWLYAASENQIDLHKQVQQEFSFDPYPDQHARVINQILLMIADGAGKIRAFTKYHYKADLIINLHLNQDNKYVLAIKPEKETLTGDIFYRDFSLEHVLVPDLADIRLRITDASGGVLYEDHFRALRIGEEDNIGRAHI